MSMQMGNLGSKSWFSVWGFRAKNMQDIKSIFLRGYFQAEGLSYFALHSPPQMPPQTKNGLRPKP
ncbi:MAG TPA: hypothetical protein DEP37_09505 [Algoriphagus sp.]|nr:hypothetical protein [Algoriphagus sp.]